MNHRMKFNAAREKINVACIPVENVSEKRESAYRDHAPVEMQPSRLFN